MLLDNEIKAGEIYVYDISGISFNEKKPMLFQLVQESKEVKREGLFTPFGGVTTEKTNPIFENIVTGELADWGTHCFTTIERIKKQYANIDSIADKSRVEFVKEASEVISAYEESLANK